MTKRIVCALLCVIFAFFLVGCNARIERTKFERVDEKPQQPVSMFIVVEGGGLDSYRIVYHRAADARFA